jgi:Right handed beta helix region
VRRFLLPLAVGLTLCAGVATAETWIIRPDGSGDAPTIKVGMDSAAAGDTVAVACGTYFEYGISLKSGVCLTSETGIADCVTVDGSGMGRIFSCDSVDTAASIVGFTAINGRGAGTGGAMYCNRSRPRIINCVFRNSHAARGGGAGIDEGAPFFTDCVFLENTIADTSHGAGVYIWKAAPTFDRCTFADNHAPGGFGGALACSSSSAVILRDCLFDHNVACGGAGAFLLSTKGVPVVCGCVFRNNVALEGFPGRGKLGGGIFARYVGPQITNCTFESNLAEGGAGVFTYDCPATITNCTFRENAATVAGGGFSCEHGAPVLTECEFVSNRGVARGGGASVAFHATPTFDHCLFAGNSVTQVASYDGGGAVGVIYNSAFAHLNSCTFSGDSAAGAGGIVFCAFSCSVSLDKCLIAFGRGGGAFSWDGTGAEPVLTCCDLFGNVGGDWTGAIADQYGANGNVSADPLFCDAGGSDFHLRSDSPCLDTEPCGTIGAFGCGCSAPLASVPDERGGDPPVFHACAPMPSPFRESTRIDFSLPAADRVKLEVFDVKGELVAALFDEYLPAGCHTATWNAIGSGGEEVPAGVYFARINAGGNTAIVKMLFLR